MSEDYVKWHMCGKDDVCQMPILMVDQNEFLSKQVKDMNIIQGWHIYEVPDPYYTPEVEAVPTGPKKRKRRNKNKKKKNRNAATENGDVNENKEEVFQDKNKLEEQKTEEVDVKEDVKENCNL